MSAEYNAKLIVELLTTEDADKATEIADEMLEIGDPIFPRTIYQAYKKFEKTTVSHYFISDLTRFEKTKDTSEILKEIAHSSTRSADVSTLTDFMSEIDYFDEMFVNKVLGLFGKELTDKTISDYNVATFCEYLTKAGRISVFEDLLRISFEDGAIGFDARKVILKQLLAINATKYFQYYYDNYSSLAGSRTEVLFVKEVTGWNNGIIPKLHEKILSEGSDTAKEIIRKHLEGKQRDHAKKNTNEQKTIEKTYLNSDILAEIANLRSKINSKAESDNRFGHSFFDLTEEIYQQNIAAKTKESFVGSCITLRSVLWKFNENIANKHVELADMQKVIPDAKDANGPLNKFHFALFGQGVQVDKDLFGFRNVQRIVSKLAHPESEAGLIALLKKEGLFEMYSQENWQELHRTILAKYKDALAKLSTAL